MLASTRPLALNLQDCLGEPRPLVASTPRRRAVAVTLKTRIAEGGKMGCLDLCWLALTKASRWRRWL